LSLSSTCGGSLKWAFGYGRTRRAAIMRDHGFLDDKRILVNIFNQYDLRSGKKFPRGGCWEYIY
jgi:hypothetical protein